MPRRQQAGMSIGIFLLISRIFGRGLNYIPPITLILIGIHTCLFMGYINPPWGRNEVCLSAQNVLIYNDYKTLFLSAFEHSTDLHLYHNMISLMMKGSSLEPRFGSQYFVLLILLFTVATSLMYVGLAKAAFVLLDEHSYLLQCAIGFSGVLFALKVLTTYYSGSRSESVYGIFTVPARYAVWLELLIIHLLVPRASFIGHLAGIIVGLLFVNGPLKIIVDTINNILNGFIGTPSYYEGERYRTGRSYTYDHGTSSQRYESYANEDSMNAEELRQRRLRRYD